MQTRVTELLGIEQPVIQGGMAWVANAQLAAAVSNAGGLGIIAAGNASGAWVREQVELARTLTTKPLGVNIMLMSPHAQEVAQAVADLRVDVVTTGAGSPSQYMGMWKDAGVKVVPVVASAALARRMERCGADAIIAEGCEAGGHIGELTTMVLVPAVVEAVSIPVIGLAALPMGVAWQPPLPWVQRASSWARVFWLASSAPCTTTTRTRSLRPKTATPSSPDAWEDILCAGSRTPLRVRPKRPSLRRRAVRRTQR